MSQIFDFLKKMVSTSSEVSHKRVIVVVFAVAIIAFCFIATYSAHIIPEFMFDALCLVVGGGMGLSVLDKVKSLKPKEEVVVPPQPQPQINQSEEYVSEMKNGEEN
jgi:hypothetical protein